MVIGVMTQSYYHKNAPSNNYHKNRTGQVYQQKQAQKMCAPEGTRRNANVQDIYEALKTSNPLLGQEEDTALDDGGLQVWYGNKPLEEWAATDPKYTDPKTGISWYVRDGKHPYMTGEDAAKFKEMCRENGEPWLKKFAEMTGVIQHLDDNTTAFVGDNGTVIKSKDGKELFIDTSSLSYDMIMNMFKNLPKSNNYFNSAYWQENIRKAGGTEPLQHKYEAVQAMDEYKGKEPENDEEESDTEIIVKPDGSKVMMTTVRVGGMETVMSMEIAGPKDSLPENPTGIIDDANVMISNTNAVIESLSEKV